MTLARKPTPDVAVADLVTPGIGGVGTTRCIRQESPRANVLIFTTYGSPNDLSRAPEAGARGTLVKNAELPELLNALLEKIGAANRTEAAAIALRKHLLKT